MNVSLLVVFVHSLALNNLIGSGVFREIRKFYKHISEHESRKTRANELNSDCDTVVSDIFLHHGGRKEIRRENLAEEYLEKFIKSGYNDMRTRAYSRFQVTFQSPVAKFILNVPNYITKFEILNLSVFCFITHCRCIDFCLSLINLFQQSGVKPIMVFDGCKFPGKIVNEERERYDDLIYTNTRHVVFVFAYNVHIFRNRDENLRL